MGDLGERALSPANRQDRLPGKDNQHIAGFMEARRQRDRQVRIRLSRINPGQDPQGKSTRLPSTFTGCLHDSPTAPTDDAQASCGQQFSRLLSKGGLIWAASRCTDHADQLDCLHRLRSSSALPSGE